MGGFLRCRRRRENQVVFRSNIGHDWAVENMPLLHHAWETPRTRVFLAKSGRLSVALRSAVGIIVFSIFSFALAQTPPGPEASPTAKASPEPTPIPLTTVVSEMQSTMTTLEEIDTSAARVQSNTDAIVTKLSQLTGEMNPRLAEDSKLLATSPSLDILYRVKLTWQDLGRNLNALARELTQHAASLEQELVDLNRLAKTWRTTLESAKQSNAPVQPLQTAVDSIEQRRQALEASRARVLTLLSEISDEEMRIRRTLSSVEQSQIRALRDLLVRDSPPIWRLRAGLRQEWQNRSGESFGSQLKAAVAFSRRLPFCFLVHASLLVVIAWVLQKMRHSIRELARDKPDLQRSLPILDLPVSTAFVLTVLGSPLIYPQAPRLLDALLGTLALIPAVAILRRLLDRSLSPILYWLVIMYFVDQLRMLVVSLPELVRFLFLAQMVGGSVFLFWLLRSRLLNTTAARASTRVVKAIRAIAMSGLVFLPASTLANIFGYVDLGHLIGMIFLRSVYIAALLYTLKRIIEGLVIIALEVQPLASLRVVTLHREMLKQRTSRVLEFLAVLFWLNFMLGFFGLTTPAMTGLRAALTASLTIGSLSISLGGILAFIIAIWASLLVSRFVRFVLEEDVYSHLVLERGIPYAISTMLHYAILLVGFFVALGALGIDLTKITILAGAFSVGIGFGLQNVINNFVSGLILLFERPIKIGDIIEVSGNTGEVRQIGIRASIIRTKDGSEVIVPNGLLISGQVTNWTLTDRGRAVEVSVSVAPTADLHQVSELLKRIAIDHPDVAKGPPPQVHVTSVTATAVAFQLRVWTERNEAWAQVRSDLSVDINQALAREKILMA
jgi:potassium-dependent mechanosensitive channel